MKKQAQREKVSYSRSHSWLGVGPNFPEQFGSRAFSIFSIFSLLPPKLATSLYSYHFVPLIRGRTTLFSWANIMNIIAGVR